MTTDTGGAPTTPTAQRKQRLSKLLDEVDKGSALLTLGSLLDHDELRPALMRRAQHKKIVPFDSADHPEDDPAPCYTKPPHTGHKKAWLVADCELILQVLRAPDQFGNAPYAPIGGSRFMLALDPSAPGQAHTRQRHYAGGLLHSYSNIVLADVAQEAVRQTQVTMLQQDHFDLAEFSALSALRHCQLWFGFGADDLGLLRAAALDGYAALVHQIVGRHFTADDTVLPRARQSMAALTRRTAELLNAYRELNALPREPRGQLPMRLARLHWPEGVDPPAEWGLSAMDQPLLQRMALQPGDFTVQELATLAVGLLVGTVGNVQSACCRVLAAWLGETGPSGATRRRRLAEAARQGQDLGGQTLEQHLSAALASLPPVVMLSRRALDTVRLGGQTIAPGEDLLLWMAAASAPCAHAGFAFGHGGASGPDTAHACLGRDAGEAVTLAVLRAVLQLPGLAEVIDPVTGRPQGLSQRWGFACTRYPLRHQRKQRLAQQPLNVVMRVKSPVDEHASALKRVITLGAPRIERALKQSRHVHFAWFQLMDQGRLLVLHTVYDGSFDDYVQHFALTVDDLFDRLFEHIEGAPPLPVAEHPGAFVDVIRAHHQPQLAGYFFSAYPHLEAAEAMRHDRGWP